MKKLKLSYSDLRSDEVLTREQLKNILGGNETTTSGPCYFDCPILESSSTGTTYLYNVQVSSLDPQGEADFYCAQVVANGHAASCTATCDTASGCV